MIEFNLFLIDHWYYSLPLFLFLVLWWRTESRRGGKRISTSELTTLVNKENAKILDVRPKDEFEKGTITNSINIPFQDIDSRYEELLTFKETPIVLVCALGRNAGLTGEKLSKKGFTNLTVLKGGISSWQQDNMPLVKP